MLHITSFVQNIAKLNNTNSPNSISTHPPSVINGLNRNYSFIYDHNLKRYDYHYNTDDDYDGVSEGYWGYLRDRNADRKLLIPNETNASSYDGYWGLFQDPQASEFGTLNKVTNLKSLEEDDECPVFNVLTPSSSSPSILSLSSSINSLSRFKDLCVEDDEKPSSLFEIYEYKNSKLKIQACKRDEMKILMQSLEDQESAFKKEIIRSFSSSSSSTSNASSSLTYPTKTKQISFLHFTNKSHDQAKPNATNSNLTNFKNMFTTLTKLNKSINIFSGDFDNLNRADLYHSFINNVHASMNDVRGFVNNYFYEENTTHKLYNLSDTQRQTTNVSLCSNIYESSTDFIDKNQKTHSTMLFEYKNVKIGFMALIDKPLFEKLNENINNKLNSSASAVVNSIEYVDYVCEADKLAKQLRQCGANIIVALTNMANELNETRLIKEAEDLDIIFSGTQVDAASGEDIKKMQINNRWLIKSGTCFDRISLVSLSLDEFNSNKILDVAITKYLIE